MESPIYRLSSIPIVLYTESPLYRLSYIPIVLYTESPMYRKSRWVVLYTDGPLYRKSVYHYKPYKVCLHAEHSPRVFIFLITRPSTHYCPRHYAPRKIKCIESCSSENKQTMLIDRNFKKIMFN